MFLLPYIFYEVYGYSYILGVSVYSGIHCALSEQELEVHIISLCSRGGLVRITAATEKSHKNLYHIKYSMYLNQVEHR